MTEYEKQKIREIVNNYIPQDRKNDYVFLENLESEILYVGNYHIESGCYKIVIIPDDADFVIKIPFNKKDWCGKVLSIEDNCLDEQNIYVRMKQRGFSCFFSEPKLFEKINGIPVYTQEKAKTYLAASDCLNEECRLRGRRYRKFRKWIKNINDGEYCSRICFFDIPKPWWAAALKYYGFEKVKQFAKYIMSEEQDICDVLADLHQENFGFRENDGSPCIIDFSSNS